jgi:hypothetical protein
MDAEQVQITDNLVGSHKRRAKSNANFFSFSFAKGARVF